MYEVELDFSGDPDDTPYPNDEAAIRAWAENVLPPELDATWRIKYYNNGMPVVAFTSYRRAALEEVVRCYAPLDVNAKGDDPFDQQTWMDAITQV